MLTSTEESQKRFWLRQRISLAVYDNQLRFRAVNNALAALSGVPAEAFVGNTIRVTAEKTGETMLTCSAAADY